MPEEKESRAFTKTRARSDATISIHGHCNCNVCLDHSFASGWNALLLSTEGRAGQPSVSLDTPEFTSGRQQIYEYKSYPAARAEPRVGRVALSESF